jgi:Domain of unknown function (DUF4912)
VSRVSLLVRDPETLFVHWDLDPGALVALRQEIGERPAALARLTLRIVDAVRGEATSVLVSRDLRRLYHRVEPGGGAFRAEVGLTLPSGAFRRLAGSEPAVTPRVGPSSERAGLTVRYSDARRLPPGAAFATAGEPVGSTVASGGSASAHGRSDAGRVGSESPLRRGHVGSESMPRRGGASDLQRR